jgi:low affinity Fe/Cu permease
MSDWFNRYTSLVASWLGRPWVFCTAFLLVLLWGASGPVFGFADVWQLVINTTTTIITFLMVFIIQNTQNRDNLAINIKLDAILREMGVEDQELLGAEDKPDQELEQQKDDVVNGS